MTSPAPASPFEPRPFWAHPALLAALVLAAAVPLLWPETPPLVDLPGHLGRYRVQLGIDQSAALARYYGFEWALIGNLGVDLLVEPLARLFGLELAVKIIVTAIPMLTVAGFLLTAREIHGRIPPTTFFALPLAYGFPFQFGFVNFALSTALALLAFPLWLRLGRSGRIGLRAALFVPLSCLIWVCHTFGWGLLGLLAYAGEVADERDRRGASRLAAFFRGGVHCIPLALPFLLMLLWRSGAVAGGNGDWFNWDAKGRWMISILRERWEAWDKAGAYLLIGLPLLAIVQLGFRMRHAAVLATLFMLIIFVALPRILFGSAYADMRLAPFMVAVAVLGLRPKGWVERRLSGALAVAGLLFFAARLAVTTHSFVDIDRVWRGQLQALEHVAPGSRVLVQVSVPCSRAWRSDRVDHIGSFAIVRRDAFTNDQWAMPGAQLVSVRYLGGAPYFVVDPSQMMRPPGCISWRETTLAWTMKRLPRRAFDYLWMINLPRANWPRDPRLIPVWNGGAKGILYRFAGSATSARETPNGSAARPTR
jgi:hypothetical protein